MFPRWLIQNSRGLTDRESQPVWLLDNPYILKWYRPTGLSVWQCLISIFHLHNQTANIWTHALGVFLAHYHWYYHFPAHLKAPLDRIIFCGAYVGILASYYCSIVYHVFNVDGRQQACFLSQVDYFGIILHLLGNLTAVGYFVYYDQLWSQVTYVTTFLLIGVISLTLNYYAMLSSVSNRMSSTKRVAFFIGVAIFSLPPQFAIGPKFEDWRLGVNAFVSDACYILAAGVYLAKWPERTLPGRFDLFNSHAVFHLLIITAAHATLYSLNALSQRVLMS